MNNLIARLSGTTGALAGLLLLSVPAHSADLAKYFGGWIVTADPNGLDGYKFRMSAAGVDLGPGECSGLPYRVIANYPSDKWNEYVSIALDTSKGPCHVFGQTVSALFLRRSKDAERIHVCFLHSEADLPYILRDFPRNTACEAHMSRDPDANDG